MTLRTVFMGSPDFAVESFRELVRTPEVKLVGAVTQPDRPKGRGLQMQPSPVKKFAGGLGLPVWQPERVGSPEFVSFLAEMRPELIIVIAYGQKIPKSILEMPPAGCINVHGSLLPEYRGAAPIHRAIIDGREKTGVTTMYMDEGWDTGDMILASELAIGPDETVGSLHDRMAIEGARILGETVRLIHQGRAVRIPQDHSLATYAPKIRPEDSDVEWSLPSRSIHNLVRGTNPWPAASTRWRGEPLRILQTRLPESQGILGNFSPGTVVQIVKGEGIIVRTGEGDIMVTEVQPAGRIRMPGEALVNGYRLAVGERLGRESGTVREDV